MYRAKLFEKPLGGFSLHFPLPSMHLPYPDLVLRTPLGDCTIFIPFDYNENESELLSDLVKVIQAANVQEKNQTQPLDPKLLTRPGL